MSLAQLNIRDVTLSLLLTLSMVELCLVDFMAPEFGSVVDLMRSLGSPLSDAQI
jgi:hypothetical protein